MKRYWLFAGSYYYPSGGMGDFQESFDTKEELLNYYSREDDEDEEYINFFEWGQMLDTETNDWTNL